MTSSFHSYFFDGGGQLLSLVCVGVVWLGFSALGSMAGGRGRMRELDPLVGWGWLGLAMTASGVFLPIPFTVLAAGAAVLAAAGGLWRWRRDGGIVPESFLKLLAITAPLLVLVSAMRASQWDEFSDWMVIPRYMLATDAFPSEQNPYPNAVFSGYPYSWHFVTYLASRLAGELLESAGALTNVLLLLMFGLVIVQLIAEGAERKELAAAPGWAFVSLGAMAVLLANPTFSQKIVLTSYAETASAVSTGAAVILGWRIIEALIDGERPRARQLAWQMGAVLALLINLKQATMALVVLVVLASFFVALRDRRVPLGDVLKLSPRIVAPALILYLVWRYYVSSDPAINELPMRPFDGWFFDIIGHIVVRMLTVFAKKGYYFALALVVIGFGIRGFFRSATPVDRFAAVAAMVVVGYNAFLLVAYLGVFGRFDAMRAASVWRYNMHLGPAVLAFAAYGAAIVWRRHLAARWDWRRVRWAPLALVLVAPFVFAKKIRFDLAPFIVHARTVGAELRTFLGPGDTYFVVDPAGSGESAVIFRFEIDRQAQFGGYVSVYHRNREDHLRKTMARPEVNTAVAFSMEDRFAAILGRTFQPNRTYLLRRDGMGPWREVKSWPRPPVK